MVTRNKFVLAVMIMAPFLLMISGTTFVNAAQFKTAGDWGCNSAAVANIKNLAKDQSKSFMGLGDYSYKCKSGSVLSLWNNVPSKKGVPGNHECQKGQDSLKAGSFFGYGSCKTKGYFAYIRGGDTAIIGLNPYGDYKKGTGQYNFVVSKTNQYANDSTIHWIIYIIHDPLYPIGCSGSHCHNLEISGFKKVYEPIIKTAGEKVLIIQAHTHLTGFGKINNIPAAVCGGGGEGGTKVVSSLKGYDWETNAPGYCLITTELGKATAQLIGTTNQVIHTHTWNR